MAHRKERADSFIQQELTIILRDKVRDPRVAALTITEVSLTQDRRLARVYVASFADQDTIKEGLAALESAKGVLRRELARVLHWPWTPELIFRLDRSWQQGERIDQLLDEVRREREAQEETVDRDSAADSDGNPAP
ncbi:MAG: 30S ribosome-binding factor RbfA [Anaerolineae bacterium]|jgi:ribosome-binding factor A|nr:30S ribosome-binding factor RbfA [Chloroflexota bacterium]